MTLSELFDDLAAQPATPPGLADRAWTAGRARRRSRVVTRAGVGLALVGVLALLLPSAGVPLTPTPATGSDVGVTSHPERIGRQWWVRDLPDRPGPMAALLKEFVGQDEPAHWQAVRADGHRFSLPEVAHRTDQYPTLSPDGRLLGYLETEEGPYVVHDLVNGERRRFAGIGDNRAAGQARYGRSGQGPAFFSPDGRWLLTTAFDRRAGDSSVLLLLDAVDGSVTVSPRLGQPAGWAADDRFVLLTDSSFDEQRSLRYATVDIQGRTVAEVDLAGTEGMFPTQWGAVVAGDGRRLALVLDGESVQRFDLVTGQALEQPVPVDVAHPCSATWGERLVVPVRGGAESITVEPGQDRPITLLSPSIEASCLLWAADAVDGPAGGAGLLGSVDATWAWWWKELVLAVLVAAVLVAGGALRRQRRP